jgi:hypothetical protein
MIYLNHHLTFFGLQQTVNPVRFDDAPEE